MARPGCFAGALYFRFALAGGQSIGQVHWPAGFVAINGHVNFCVGRGVIEWRFEYEEIQTQLRDGQDVAV